MNIATQIVDEQKQTIGRLKSGDCFYLNSQGDRRVMLKTDSDFHVELSNGEKWMDRGWGGPDVEVTIVEPLNPFKFKVKQQ